MPESNSVWEYQKAAVIQYAFWDVVFYAKLSDFSCGVYARIDGTLRVIADMNTPIPGGTGNFVNFPEEWTCGVQLVHGTPRHSPVIQNGQVVFRGQGASGLDGIYHWDGTSISIVADTNTPSPSGTGNFTRFLDQLSFDNGDLAFQAGAPHPSSV